MQGRQPVIQRIGIKNWRAYHEATVELDRPMVFFVAPNGVGKSSLFEAVRGCLLGFPSGQAAGRAVRAGAAAAELSLDLAVGEASTVTVTRTLTRTGRASFAATRDGEPLDEDAFLRLLQESWSTDPALLDRLMFGDPTAGRSRGSLPIRDHLAELLGVTPMLEAAGVLRRAQRDVQGTVADLRADVAGVEDAIVAAEAGVEEAQSALAEVTSQREDLRPNLVSAERAARLAASWTAYRAEAAAYNDQVQQLLSDISDMMTVDPSTPEAALTAARQEAESELESARTAIAEADRASLTAATASDLLASADEVCPTCLRPISEDERVAALHAHGAEVTTASTQSADLTTKVARAQQHLQAISEFTRRLDRLQPPTAPDVDDPGPGAAVELDELRALDSTLSERLGEARARRDAALASLQQARASADDAARLHEAAREELLLETTANVLEGVADRYLSERIEPLTRDIAHRWKLVFGTEGLELDPAGEITLRRGDVGLALADMSGGERAVAGIIVRLLVAAAATRIPSVWFDEPLEHLDPRRRAAVAQVLVQAAATRTVDQIVVTTYEEGIAHRLALAAPDLVTVIYADADTTDVSDTSPR